MLSVGVVSYSICIVFFVALAALLATRWRGRFGGFYLLLAVVTSAVWAVTMMLSGLQPPIVPFGVVALIDMLRALVWLTLIWRLIEGPDRVGSGSSIPAPLRKLFFGAWIGVVACNVLVYLYGLVTADQNLRLLMFIATGFALALATLIMVEQLFRNSAADVRWTIKFFCLAVGGMFAYDIYLYASGFLFLNLDTDLWEARGAVNALAIPFLAVSISRSGRLARNQFVSSHVVFYSSALLGVGVYLVLMAAGGYAVRYYGGTWGAFAQILFLSGALFLLAAVLFSGQARARVNVFLTKHFLDYRYDYREEWLKLTRALASTDGQHPLSLVSIKAVADLIDSPGGALWYLDDRQFRLERVWNLTVDAQATEPADSPFIGFLQDREWIIDLNEWQQDRHHYDNLRVPDWLVSIDEAWLVVPLKQSEKMLGFMVLARARAMRELTFEDHDLLKTVGRQIAGHLALNQSVQLLAETRQFQAYNRLTAFIMHDLKNLIAQQSLVVKNAARHKDKPEFIDDAIATVDNSVQRMNRLLEQLRRGESQRGSTTSRLGAICRDVVAQNDKRQPEPQLSIEESGLRVMAPAETLTMVLGHLVRNAQEATSPEGSVNLIVGREADHAIITIRDTGTGMSPEFVRERLFRPFDTTKGTKGMGIGVYQARDFMRSVGGRLDVDSVEGEGTTFVARLPLVATADGDNAVELKVAHEENH